VLKSLRFLTQYSIGNEQHTTNLSHANAAEIRQISDQRGLSH